jgi:hypothetical protein
MFGYNTRLATLARDSLSTFFHACLGVGSRTVEEKAKVMIASTHTVPGRPAARHEPEGQ